MNSQHTLLFKRIVYLFVLMTVLVSMWPGEIVQALAGTTPPSKNDSQPIESSGDSGNFIAQQPEPSSKNAEARKAGNAPSDVTSTSFMDFSSKNYVENLEASMTDAFKSTQGSANLPSCGESGNMNWNTTSSSFQIIRQCTLRILQDGYVFISSTGSVARQDGDYEAQFEIGIDSTSGDANIDRWVNVYNDSGDGNDESFALSVLKPVLTGTHTFYSLGKRYGGTGTVLLYDPTLTVVFIPASYSRILPCGQSGNLNWNTTSSSFQVIRQCNLTVPQNGYVFISADSSVARQDGEYEAQFEIGIDSTSGDTDIDRWLNVYDDSGDGTDKSVALSVLKPVTAGAHTFYSLGKRYGGTGTVLLYDSTLTVIFIPSSYSQVIPCGESGNMNWNTTSSSFQVILQCSLTLPHNGFAFISTDSSVARQDGEYEAQFEIGIDSTSGDANIDRWVNVYNDSGDGTDKSVALSVLKPVTPGIHTFYSLGKRYAGAGTVLLYDPTLTVIYFSSFEQIFIPSILKR